MCRGLLAALGLALGTPASPALGAFPGANGDRVRQRPRRRRHDRALHRRSRRVWDPATDDELHVGVQPSFSPAGSRITFDRAGSDIDVVNADGTGETQLTNSADFEFDAASRPTVSKIAYVRITGADVEIFSMNADGTGQTNLTNSQQQDLAPVFSPDGSRIAFLPNGNVFVVNADGSGPTALTAGGLDAAPSFSPDGQRIALLSNRDGNVEIYVMNADGTNVVRLTNNPATDGGPAFAPDGSKIAFTQRSRRQQRRLDHERRWLLAGEPDEQLQRRRHARLGGDCGRPGRSLGPRRPGTTSRDHPPVPRGRSAIGGERVSCCARRRGICRRRCVQVRRSVSESQASPGSAGAGLGPLPGTAIPATAGSAGPGRGAGTDSDDPVNDNPGAPMWPPSSPGRTRSSCRRPTSSAASASLRCFMLLLGLPARLFNKTVQQNRGELTAFFAPVRAAVAAITPGMLEALLGVAAVSATTTAAVHVSSIPRSRAGRERRPSRSECSSRSASSSAISC